MSQSDFDESEYGNVHKNIESWYIEHESKINRILEDNQELWKYHDLDHNTLEKHREDIARLSNTVYGIDGNNGLRGKSKDFQLFIDTIRPDHAKLMEKLEEFHSIKKSFTKVIWLLVATALISLVTNWTKIQSNDARTEAIQSIQQEISKIVQDQLKNAAP